MLTPWALSARIMCAICSTMTGATPSEGSSSKTKKGLPIKVRATVSICCSPPLMLPPGRCGISPRLGKSSNKRSGVQCGATLPSGHCRTFCLPTSRFSMTVRSVNMRRSSGTKPRPKRAAWCGSLCERSWPMKVTCPRLRASIPIKALSVVDLPAPLRPIRATTSPRRTCKSTSYKIWAAPYQAARPLASSKMSDALMWRISQKSSQCRNKLLAPWGDHEFPAACPQRSSGHGPARSCGRHRQRPRPCCAR